MSCRHHWIGGTPHSIKVRTVCPKGERPREVFEVIDHNGEHVDTYTCEEEAVESAGRLALGVCSECGALFEKGIPS